MNLLVRLNPINLLEEKAKFMADTSYNPQFLYEEPSTEKELVKYGVPLPQHLTLAQEILDHAYFNKSEEELMKFEGPRLLQDEVTQKIKTFLKMHELENRYKIVWSSSFVSRTTISTDTVKLRLPADFRKEGLLGMLYHEIGTHALRQINYENQPWFKQKKKYGFSDYLLTEEGLASFHTLIPHTHKSAFNIALRYLAVHYAQTCSFAELWQKMSPFVDNLERRWIIVVRQKRGLNDTSQPGGFTKDLVYFQGLIEVWHWLKEHNYDITDLYYGKMAKEDIEKAKQMNPKYNPFLPSFYTLNPDQYKENIVTIAKANFLTV